jgi:hypothetical protein
VFSKLSNRYLLQDAKGTGNRDIEAVREEIFLVASDMQESFECIDNYLRTLHKRSSSKGS